MNLNPDTACNFNCIYCQVDRTGTPRARHVQLDVLSRELDVLLASAIDGSIFSEPEFSDTPPRLRRLNDIAFSGDGEPTACPVFKESVQLAADLKRRHGADDAKLILITNACYLKQPSVVAALKTLDNASGYVWAKLDAGTEEYYRLINQPNCSLAHVIENITHAARARPVTIQALFMRVDSQPPAEDEIAAFTERLNEIIHAGGRLELVQVYTVARPPAEDRVTALENEELDGVARSISSRTSVPVECFYG